ncbi:MAG: transposase [Firmicutes bacterium]|nr:transposase [Bacillota bacterium]
MDHQKSIDGLAVLVREGFHLDPFSSCLFVFCKALKALPKDKQDADGLPGMG